MPRIKRNKGKGPTIATFGPQPAYVRQISADIGQLSSNLGRLRCLQPRPPRAE